MARLRPAVDGPGRDSDRGCDGRRVHELLPSILRAGCPVLVCRLVPHDEEATGHLGEHGPERHAVGWIGAGFGDGIEDPVEHGGNEIGVLAGVGLVRFIGLRTLRS